MEKTYKILKLLIWILSFAVLLVGATVLYNNLKDWAAMPGIATVAPQETAAPQAGEVPQETEKVRQMAPDFTVYDLEGNPHKLSDFVGKPVILNFWASWCGPCQSEMPAFQKFYETYGSQVHFLLVNLTDGRQETVETASAYIAGGGYSFPVYYDTDIDAAMQYGVQAVPVTYFVDAEGYLLAYAQGALNEDMLQQGMDLLLK